jgi:hypothetical protein
MNLKEHQFYLFLFKNETDDKKKEKILEKMYEKSEYQYQLDFVWFHTRNPILKLNAKEKMSSLRVKRKFSKKHKESI